MRTAGNGNKLNFAADIPLAPGRNLVTIVARENSEVQSSHTLYLFRSDGGTVATNKP